MFYFVPALQHLLGARGTVPVGVGLQGPATAHRVLVQVFSAGVTGVYLGGLHDDGDPQQPLTRQSDGERNRTGLHKLDVGDALRPAGVPVRDHPHQSDLREDRQVTAGWLGSGQTGTCRCNTF